MANPDVLRWSCWLRTGSSEIWGLRISSTASSIDETSDFSMCGGTCPVGDLLSKLLVFAQQLSKDPCAGYLRLAMWDKIVILPGKKHSRHSKWNSFGDDLFKWDNHVLDSWIYHDLPGRCFPTKGPFKGVVATAEQTAAQPSFQTKIKPKNFSFSFPRISFNMFNHYFPQY